ncbi:MAG TPA: NHL repeat-containing protein [Gammaproteobacteria bacterium]
MRLLLLIIMATMPALATAAAELLATSAADFGRPHDLTLSTDGRHLYVTDMEHDQVRVLDPQTLRDLGAFGKGELKRPHDVAFAGDGRLLVADSDNDRVVLYRVDGAAATRIDTLPGRFATPEGVAAAGAQVAVSNVRQGTVVLYLQGRQVRSTGSIGQARGQFLRPHDLEFGPDGRLYVADPGNDRVQVLDATLSVVEVIGPPAVALNEPKYLALDPQGLLYVADQHNDRVVVLDAQRREVAVIGAGQLNRPEGVAVRGELVWVSDTYNDRVLLYRWQR